MANKKWDDLTEKEKKEILGTAPKKKYSGSKKGGGQGFPHHSKNWNKVKRKAL